MREDKGIRGLHIALLIALAGLGAWSAFTPRDRLTWFLEAAPVIIGVPILAFTYRSFRLTDLAYILIFAHSIILLIGGHYTYAEVPLFNWIRDALSLSRNHFDRVGHFAQGFIPAIIAREVLIRRSPVDKGGWLFLFVTSISLSISAFYELIEWWAAVTSKEATVAFLGSQGDIWDTQWDMFMALIGALASQISLAGLHDRALDKLREAGLF